MTPQQRRALDFITQHHAEHRHSPSLVEIAQALGLKARSGAHRIVFALIQSGHLVRTAGGQRNIAPARFNLSHVPVETLRAELQRREDNRG